MGFPDGRSGGALGGFYGVPVGLGGGELQLALKALSGDGNPTLSTVMKVAKALGLKVSIQPGA